MRASTLTNVLALHFKVKFDQLFVQRVLRSRLTLNLQIKLESSEAYLPKLEKTESVLGFRNYSQICKNAVLNICRYLKRFYIYKKINNIFFKCDHSLLRMPEIMEIG